MPYLSLSFNPSDLDPVPTLLGQDDYDVGELVSIQAPSSPPGDPDLNFEHL